MFRSKCFIILLFTLIANTAYASPGIGTDVGNFIDGLLKPLVDILAFLFLGGDYELFGEVRNIKIFGFPILVGWLVIGGIFFTIKLRFVNFRLFTHGINAVRGKYSKDSDPGKVTHAQALFTAVSATVGLGNIAGVAIAVTLGGPGAVIWMMIAAVFGMSAKFAEVTWGVKYRRFHKGHLLSGAFYYLQDGLKEMGHEKLGKTLALIAAIFCIGGAIGAGIMFQANQSVLMMSDTFGLSSSGKMMVALTMSALLAFILIGGITRIASVAQAIVPSMALLYVAVSIIILIVHRDNLLSGIGIMFQTAFTGTAVSGGIIGAIIQGFRRAAFSNEAGIGSAPIAHAAAKTKEPVREGAVAILEPFIDTIVICFMTGLVITVTGVYEGADTSQGGVLITKAAFVSVVPWFDKVLSFIVFLFAFSTMLTYSYYGRQAWMFLTKERYLKVCYWFFILFVFVGGMINFGTVIDLADILFLSMAIPNLIGLYMMSGKIKAEMDSYIKKLKAGKFEITK